MSIASISYGSIKDASNGAKEVSRRLNSYAGAIENSVYNKLNNYNGSWTSEIFMARTKLNSKISSLYIESQKYSSYSADLIELREECESVDISVRSRISSLTASFKERNGIANNKVENAINYFITKIGNSTTWRRWISDKSEKFKVKKDYLKSLIKEWYNYDGGKDAIKEGLVALIECVIGVLSIIAALGSGSLLGVIGGIILLANGIANICNEYKAYEATQNNDPATGKRRSKIDTCQDYLRSSFIFGDDGTKYEYSETYNNIALGIDVVNLVCVVGSVVSNCGKLLKNGYKWLTGSARNIKNIKFKEIFSKDTLKIFSKESGISIKKIFIKDIIKDIGRNLKSEFFNFEKTSSTVNSIKNIITIPKNLLENKLSFRNIITVTIKNIIMPAITAFTVNSTDGTIVTGEGGQMQFDFTDKITFDDIYSVSSKINLNLLKLPMFSGNSKINIGILGKLSSISNLNISIPEINAPKVYLPVIRAV